MLDSIPLKLVFSLQADIKIHLIPNKSGAHTSLVKFISGSFSGPKLQGKLMPEYCADVGHVKADGSLKAEVNLLLRTDDNAEFHMHYLASAMPQPSNQTHGTRSTPPKRQTFNFPFFNTASEKYRWLNTLQALTVYSSSEIIDDNGTLRATCDVYELMPPQ